MYIIQTSDTIDQQGCTKEEEEGGGGGGGGGGGERIFFHLNEGDEGGREGSEKGNDSVLYISSISSTARIYIDNGATLIQGRV